MEEYAPVNRTLEYDDPDHIRDNLGEALGNPYDVAEDYYVGLALRQWKVCPSEVASEFFSVKNIKRIQRGIRREIYNRSYGKFKLREDQNVLDLLQAMVIVYKWYGKNLPKQVVRQVKILNAQTIQYVAPDMMTNLKQYYSYLDDIKNPIDPIQLPLNVNHAGRDQIPSVAQLYGI
jgi:hypothetical protein